MPSPDINDGSPVHGYNLYKFLYHAKNGTIGSRAGSILSATYSYVSGIANDGMMIRVGIETDGAISSSASASIVRSGTTFGSDTAIGSILVGANSFATNGVISTTKDFVITGSMNMPFDINVWGFGNENGTRINFVTIESW